ncbi:MAG: response regulator, partial [Polyangiaceae bacterium]|nr:response regulator [Polyangiaceae bacterium]
MERFLAHHDVTLVRSTADATDAIRERDCDAVLVDYDLDDGKGDALVKAICASASRAIIVAVSAHEHGNDI